MTILFCNFLAYVLWFVWSFKRSKFRMNVYTLALVFFVAIAFLGFFTFSTGIYQHTFGEKDEASLSVIPFICNGICVWLFLFPLKKLRNIDSTLDIRKYESFLSRLSILFLTVFGIQALFSMTSVDISSIDYADVYNDAAAGISNQPSEGTAGFIRSKTIMLARLAVPFFYIIQCLLLTNTKKIRYIVFILVAYLLLLIPQILTANRGGMFFSTTNLLFFLVVFWNGMTSKVKKYLGVFLAGGLLIMSSFAVAISNARFEQVKTTDGTEQILRYFGEAYPNLGFNIWPQNVRHPYGARMFPNYSAILTGENLSKNYRGGRNASFYFWERYVGIPMLNFKTLFGDLFVEFGFWGVWCIAAVWLVFITIVGKNRGIIGTVTFSYFAFQSCVWGLFGSNFSEQYVSTIVYTIVLLWLWKKTNFGKISHQDKALLV